MRQEVMRVLSRFYLPSLWLQTNFNGTSRSDEGLTLETSALWLVTVANLHFQLSWYNQITLLPPPTQHHSFFRNFHP